MDADDRFLYGMALCSCIMLFFALAVPMGVALKFFAVAWTMVCFTVLGIAISEEI